MRRQFDFIGRRNLWFSISGAVILIGIASMFFHKGLNLGIDFTGGTRMQLRLEKSFTVGEVRDAVSGLGLADSVIQPLGSNEVIITTQYMDTKKENAVIKAIDAKIGVSEKMGTESVGPSFGRQVARQSGVALAVSLAAILIYIAIRFELNAALAAIIALLHDLLVVIGVYALLNRQITVPTVAAVLTILGYSLYDTVVVYDRIRENAHKMLRGERYDAMVNRSVNQTLIRSINTTLSAIIPIGAMLIFGGETIKDFSLALFIGMASGAYSSIFIASPLIVVMRGGQEGRSRAASVQKPVKKAIVSRAAGIAERSAEDSAERAESIQAKNASVGPTPHNKGKGGGKRGKKKRRR